LKCYVLLNHEVSDTQKNQLAEIYQVSEIVQPHLELKERWGNIPPVPEMDKRLMELAVHWFDSIDSSDIVFLQGESCHTFALVDYLLSRGIKVVASVTARKATEKKVGEKVIKTSEFVHTYFREYRRL